MYIYNVFDTDETIIASFVDEKCAQIYLASMFDKNPGHYFYLVRTECFDHDDGINVINDCLEGTGKTYEEAEIHCGITLYYEPDLYLTDKDRDCNKNVAWNVGSEFFSLKPIKDLVKEDKYTSRYSKEEHIEYAISFKGTLSEDRDELIKRAREILNKHFGMSGKGNK